MQKMLTKTIRNCRSIKYRCSHPLCNSQTTHTNQPHTPTRAVAGQHQKKHTPPTKRSQPRVPSEPR